MYFSNDWLRDVRPIEWILSQLAPREVVDEEGGLQPFGTLLPAWVAELSTYRSCNPTEALVRMTPLLVDPVCAALVGKRDLTPIGSILRTAATLHILSSQAFPAIDNKILKNYVDASARSMREAGAALASWPDLFLDGDYLAVCTAHGIRKVTQTSPQDLSEKIEALAQEFPLGQIFRFGTNQSIGIVATKQNQVYCYPLSIDHWFAIACASDGVHNPYGRTVGHLLKSRNYFPFVGSLMYLAAKSEEVESGLSWWMIPKLTPLNHPVVNEELFWDEKKFQ